MAIILMKRWIVNFDRNKTVLQTKFDMVPYMLYFGINNESPGDSSKIGNEN